MNPIPFPEGPAVGEGYIPYFYQAGLHQLYALPASAPQRGHDSLQASTEVQPGDPFFDRADRTQTVEQIIAHGYFSIPRADPTTAILSDKGQTSWLGLDDLISQVRQRADIYRRNLDQIEHGKCAAMNAIYHHVAYNGPPSSKQMYAKHKAIQDLYEQERTERTSHWKDVSRLRTLLPESAQQYLAAHRKMSILAGDPGDEP